jgi:hypothetical protein
MAANTHVYIPLRCYGDYLCSNTIDEQQLVFANHYPEMGLCAVYV